MKLLKSLILAGAVSVMPGLHAQTQPDLTPEIIFPDEANGTLLYGLSDNGLWGVACMEAGETGFAEFSGAVLYDLSKKPVVATNLTKGESFGAAYDVTDDGKIVAGSTRRQPAVCRNVDGVWTWQILPIPQKEYDVQNVFTGETMKYKLTGGEVTNITPDGRYCVGMAVCNEYIMFEMACMWDLETGELMELPGLNVANTRQSRFTQISADGRYLLGRGISGGGYSVYDRETKTVKSVRGVGLDIYAMGMSTDGHYISGVHTVNDIDYGAVLDMWTDELTVIDGMQNADACAWCTSNGIPLLARPYITPYADAYVYYDGFMFSFEDVLSQVYGLNLRRLGIDNTGKPFQVSADGKTIVMLTAPSQCYVLKLKEDLPDILERIDLMNKWTATPADGTRMTSISGISVNFGNLIELSPDASGKIRLLDSNGNTVATPLPQGGVQVNGNNLNIQFRSRLLNPDEEYTVVIDENTVWIKDRPRSNNKEIHLKYTGRENVPVKPTKISPEEGSALASLDLSDNPVAVTFDTKIKVNGTVENRPLAHVYIDDMEEPLATVNIDVDLISGNTMVIYPPNTLHLYKGSTYYIKVPEAAVVDMSGSGPNEEFTITYTGAYTPELGDEKYLFHSTCDDYTNFLFYEGDHNTPVAEYSEMGFDADSTPWSVVRESEESTDMAFGSHSVYTNGGKSDDWVTTRQILIPEGCKAYLSFDAQSYRRIKEDYLKVYIYRHAGVLNALNSSIVKDIRENGDLVFDKRLDPGASEAMLSGDWEHVVIPLDDYVGDMIYVCFVNENQNQSMVIIDNIDVVREVKAFLTMRNQTNVVNQPDITLWGMVTASTETADYKGVEMTLKDGEGNVVSTISDKDVTLKYNDTYSFEFPDALPLTAGIENQYTIEYTVGDNEMTYEGVVRNLTFEPVKRVVVEEFTGRDCQFCPGGIVTMEHLENLYGDRLIPVALHCYQGSDPKGSNVMGYWEFTGMDAAPQGRINRRGITAPLFYSDKLNRYVNTKADLPEGEMAYLWKDEVADEMKEPALMQVDVEYIPGMGSTLNYQAKVRSAITLSNQNIRVFGVLVEDGLEDYQRNAYYATQDPILGEWQMDGLYGKAVAMNPTPIFNNVARSVWGQSYNGTAGLIPDVVEAANEYVIDIKVPVPAIVSDTRNCKLVVMLIDENTGRVINSAVSTSISGVQNVNAADGGISISTSGDKVMIKSETASNVNIYSPSGMLITSGTGTGSYEISLNGYKGMIIVKAVNANGEKTGKYVIR